MAQKSSFISKKVRSTRTRAATSAGVSAHLSASKPPLALITASEAVRRLGIKPATLYAYVSRGLLRSAGLPDSRERRYYAEDVERLKRLRRSGRRMGIPAKPFDSLAPALDSAICLVENGRLYYRGIDTSELADHADLEEIARLLWQSESLVPFEAPELSAILRRRISETARVISPINRAQSVLVELARDDIGALDVAIDSVARTGGRLVPALAAAITGSAPTKAAIHVEMANAWHLDQKRAELIRRCLVLAADHELNTSTYVARCVASTGASPYAAIIAALSALSGPRHGGQAIHVEHLLRDLIESQDVMGVLAERLQRGEGILGFGGERMPGFGHPLYPNGDPRAVNILEALRASDLSRRSNTILKIGEQVSDLVGRQPNFDFAIGAVSAALDLPRGSGLGIWLVGRTVGWIAHAIEQYTIGTLIRPRARYAGVWPVPETGS
jgi:citrate synthase